MSVQQLQIMNQVLFPSFYGPSTIKHAGNENKERKDEANKMLIVCKWLCWLFQERNEISFVNDVSTGDQGLEVRVATCTYGPEIDQSQHMKSVSHIQQQ